MDEPFFRGDSFDLKTLFEKQHVGLHGLDPFPRFDRTKLFEWSRESDLAYACIQKIIEAAQDPDLIVERRGSSSSSGSWEAEPGHPLRRLVMRPNSEMTQAEFLGAWLASEEVCGEFFAEIERDRRGRPAALWPLDPTCILPAHIPYPNSGMEGWIWRGYGEKVHLLPRDVFYTLRRDPQCPWLPLAPLRVALGSIEADAMQTAFVRSFFKNSGVPSGIIKIKGRSLKD
jgi:phage portal protein BeeE